MRDGNAIATALNGRRVSRGWEFVCPVHTSSKHKRSAYLYDDGKLWCFGCGDWKPLAKKLDQMSFLDDGKIIKVDPEKIAADEAARIADAQQRWADALDDPEYVGVYLKRRGINLPVPPVLKRWNNGFMALLQSRTDEITAIHCKSAARFEIHGVMRGSAVKLAAPRDGAIGLAEGVENALSATQLYGVPTWAVIGTRLDAVDLPAGLRKVHLFPDNDGVPGRAAADRAKWHYYEQYNVDVETWWPPKGLDWNDFLRGKK